MDPVTILENLVRTPSVSREKSEIADVIAELVGGDIQEFPIRGRPRGRNVIAISEPHPGEPFILLNGHHDTVAPAHGWSTDPFDPVRDGDRISGLGTNDMKAGLAGIISLFNEFRNRVNLIFSSSADEESNSMGSFALMDPEAGPLSRYLDRISGVLVAEPTGERVMLGARGRYALVLTILGKAAHGARPHLGINAIDGAAQVAQKLGELKLDSHPDLGSGSYCILGIKGGTQTLSVPDRCELVVDRHYTHDLSPEGVIDEFRELVGHLDIEARVDIALVDREVPFLKPYACSRDEPFVDQFLRSVVSPDPRSASLTPSQSQFPSSSSSSSSASPAPSPTSSGSSSPSPPFPPIIYGASVGDYNIFGNVLPTIVYGPSGGQHHSADEFVSISSMEKVTGQLRRWLNSLSKVYLTREK